jgi:pimeloyl-ACP methyl ester carboxylesterase
MMTTVRLGDFDIAFRSDGLENRPLVLLIHGWPDDASTWDSVAPVLRDTGFRTIAPTLRGFGEAPRDVGSILIAFFSGDTPSRSD